jgi:hypothetical protein
VEEQIHRAEPADAVHDLDAAERVVFDVLLLIAVELGVARQVRVRDQEEAARAKKFVLELIHG